MNSDKNSLASEGEGDLGVTEATLEAIHDFEAYRENLAQTDRASEPIAAIGIAGDAEAVKRLTRGLSLLR